jgi:hypothetical protein
VKPRLGDLLYGAALLLAVAPLWAGAQLPFVDLPQHLHLINALHHLHDPATLYPTTFALRHELTPYWGYYFVVDLLAYVLPLDVANKVFLSAYVAGMALGMAFLLRSLGRPRWPSLLCLPFAYGDSLNWGFINYCASLPLVFLSLGLFVRALKDVPGRKKWALAHAVVLVAVLLFHVQAFAFLALGLPLLLLTTRVPEDAERKRPVDLLRPRLWALASVVPAAAVFLSWVVLRLGEPTQVEQGAPWKAWGPMLSPQNLSFKSFEQNQAELFQVLANTFHDHSDRLALNAVLWLAALAWVARLWFGGTKDKHEGKLERWRLLALGGVALVLYFTLPFDIRGYMYYLSTRFAHLAGALLVAAVPPVSRRARAWLLPLAAAASVTLAVPYWNGFSAFADEAAPLLTLAQSTPDRPRIVGLIYDSRSAVVTHPVYLHAATVLARLRGGLTNFSFATTPHSPLRYQGEPPPTFPSEWDPSPFRLETMGQAYDTFLISARGQPGGITPPRALFGGALDNGLTVAGHSGPFWLVTRK